jgi:hypothetical protein
MIGNVPVTSISIENHELHVMNLVAQDCYQGTVDVIAGKSPPSGHPRRPFPTPKTSSLLLAVTLTRTLGGSKTEKTTPSAAHFNAQASTTWSMGLAPALGAARWGFRMGLKILMCK